MDLECSLEGEAATILGARGERTDALGPRRGGQAIQLGDTDRGDGLLGQLDRECAVGALLVGLHGVAVRHDPAVGVDDGPAAEFADRPRPDHRGRPVLQRSVAVAPMRTAIMTTAGLARKTADWSSVSVAASDAAADSNREEPGQRKDH